MKAIRGKKSSFKKWKSCVNAKKMEHKLGQKECKQTISDAKNFLKAPCAPRRTEATKYLNILVAEDQLDVVGPLEDK